MNTRRYCRPYQLVSPVLAIFIGATALLPTFRVASAQATDLIPARGSDPVILAQAPTPTTDSGATAPRGSEIPANVNFATLDECMGWMIANGPEDQTYEQARIACATYEYSRLRAMTDLAKQVVRLVGPEGFDNDKCIADLSAPFMFPGAAKTYDPDETVRTFLLVCAEAAAIYDERKEQYAELGRTRGANHTGPQGFNYSACINTLTHYGPKDLSEQELRVYIETVCDAERKEVLARGFPEQIWDFERGGFRDCPRLPNPSPPFPGSVQALWVVDVDCPENVGTEAEASDPSTASSALVGNAPPSPPQLTDSSGAPLPPAVIDSLARVFGGPGGAFNAEACVQRLTTPGETSQGYSISRALIDAVAACATIADVYASWPTLSEAEQELLVGASGDMSGCIERAQSPRTPGVRGMDVEQASASCAQARGRVLDRLGTIAAAQQGNTSVGTNSQPQTAAPTTAPAPSIAQSGTSTGSGTQPARATPTPPPPTPRPTLVPTRSATTGSTTSAGTPGAVQEWMRELRKVSSEIETEHSEAYWQRMEQCLTREYNAGRRTFEAAAVACLRVE